MNRILTSVVLSSFLLAAGCRSDHNNSGDMHSGMHHDMSKDSGSMHHDMGMMSNVSSAIAVLHPTQGNSASGVVHFHAMGGGLHVVADISGLDPNSTHGFHIHEFGDCSAPDGMSTGGHFAGAGHQHGKPTDAYPNRHAGDMGNITADANGKAHLEIMLNDVTLTGDNAVLGRGVIVHAKADDFGQPTGNAGGRIACGVIGAAK